MKKEELFRRSCIDYALAIHNKQIIRSLILFNFIILSLNRFDSIKVTVEVMIGVMILVS